MILLMMHLLLMLTTLEAVRGRPRNSLSLTLRWTNWVNDYDGRMDWVAGRNNMVNGWKSVHDNRREDRRWKFEYGSVSGVTTGYCRAYWVNNYDQRFSFTCPHDWAINGFYSVHNNRREDRIWRIQCCEIHGASLRPHGWSGYLGYFDRQQTATCDHDEVLIGLASFHNNRKEDRLWKRRCARLTNDLGYAIKSHLTGYINDWDRSMSFSAGSNKIITGFYSYHSNRREDRRWRVYYGSTSLTCTPGGWSNWRNSWDRDMTFSCPSRAVLNGIQSYHNNRKEDRRWQFKCCNLPSNVYVERRETHWINNYDARMNWVCPNSNAVVGLFSIHDNRREDRRWRVDCGEILQA